MGQLPRERRITTRREIAALLRGARARGPALELYRRPAAGPIARATCITPKHGHTGVARNRLRRRIKELIREILLSRGEGEDWLVRTRPAAYDLSHAELRAMLQGLADQGEPR
ncbi:MAG TPA: ribonuclease P protein component [Gemmatimonadota bacterium]|nr:ribonuclease P protein component [Gemmatimonadota bacterium]